jgi:hypothetical protein
MELTPVQEAGTWLEKANANLDPDLLSIETVREQFAVYARAERLVAYGKTMLARKLDDAGEVARTTGVSVGKAKVTVDTGKALSDAMEVCDAFKSGDISADQASEIARAEQAEPGSASELLEVAERESFQVLRERARKVVLAALDAQRSRRGLYRPGVGPASRVRRGEMRGLWQTVSAREGSFRAS